MSRSGGRQTKNQRYRPHAANTSSTVMLLIHFIFSYALVKHAPLTLDIFAKDGMAVPIGIPDPRQVPRRENRNTWRPHCGSQMRGAIVIPDVESAPFEHLSRLHIGSLAGQVISSAVPGFTQAFSYRVVLRPSQYQ